MYDVGYRDQEGIEGRLRKGKAVDPAFIARVREQAASAAREIDAFPWSQTPQGYRFWVRVFNQLQYLANDWDGTATLPVFDKVGMTGTVPVWRDDEEGV